MKHYWLSLPATVEAGFAQIFASVFFFLSLLPVSSTTSSQTRPALKTADRWRWDSDTAPSGVQYFTRQAAASKQEVEGEIFSSLAR